MICKTKKYEDLCFISFKFAPFNYKEFVFRITDSHIYMRVTFIGRVTFFRVQVTKLGVGDN